MARKRLVAETSATPEDSPLEPSEVSMALAPQPAPMGMVRIAKGKQQRCIWPVHLAGWQELGWRPVTLLSAVAPQQEEPQSIPADASDEPAVEPPLNNSLAEAEGDAWLSNLAELS
jgi:hypothetical protein